MIPETDAHLSLPETGISLRLWLEQAPESFDGKLRGEVLDREIFYTLAEAKVLIERWHEE